MFFRSWKNKKNTEKVADTKHSLVEVAYGLDKGQEELATREKEHSKNILDAGWTKIHTSADYEDTSLYNYRSVAYVNEDSKEVLIATAGTKATNYNDLIDDALLATGSAPRKITPMKEFISKTLEKLGNNASEYSIGTAGHSLGAVMSDLTLAELASRGQKISKSTTFENPGSRLVVSNAIKVNLFTGKVEQSLDDLGNACTEYNAKPNFINKAGTHLAKELYCTTTKQVNNNEQEKEASSSFGYGSYLFSKVGSALYSCADYLGLSNAVSQIKSHSNGNFHSDKYVDGFEVESWNGEHLNQTVLPSDNISELKKIDSTGADLFAFDQNDVDGFNFIDKYEFAYSDLHRFDSEFANSEALGNLANDGWETIV